jgi:transposase
MYGVDMYYTVKTLLSKGISQRQIAKSLGISRNTVAKIVIKIAAGQSWPPLQTRNKRLSDFHDQIRELAENNKSAVLIHDRLTRIHDLSVSYPTVARYVRQFKRSEVFVPMLCDPGEEAQVDFGYLGRYIQDGKSRKVWVFSFILSHSRLGYHELVLDQKVSTFIACHIHSFEYLGGVPATIKIDNLKAGVITPSFYEPIIQEQYARFLKHYGCSPIVSRPYRPQDKGKVESGIKYVVNNFVPRLDHHDFDRAKRDLALWNDNVSNVRVHGTTRKVPLEVFNRIEKKALLQLPPQRYEMFDVEQRKVATYHHVLFKYNYYSVPHNYFGQQVMIRSNGSVLRIYNERQEIALHGIAKGTGQYITREEHKPPNKQRRSREYYINKVNQIGPSALLFMHTVEQKKPRHWHEMIRGIISLTRVYEVLEVDMACQRALDFDAISYQTVKNILEKGLCDFECEDLSVSDMGGYGHELSIYDNLK